MTGGLLVTVARPETFTRLFLLNAATFLAYMGVVLRLPLARSRFAAAATGGYQHVLHDRPFLGVAAVNFLLVAGGIALLELGFIAGPGLGGLVLAARGVALWPAAAAVCLAAAIGALALERWIPPPYRTTPIRDARRR